MATYLARASNLAILVLASQVQLLRGNNADKAVLCSWWMSVASEILEAPENAEDMFNVYPGKIVSGRASGTKQVFNFC